MFITFPISAWIYSFWEAAFPVFLAHGSILSLAYFDVLSSTIYHAVTWFSLKSVCIIDHSMIYIAIAGSYASCPYLDEQLDGLAIFWSNGNHHLWYSLRLAKKSMKFSQCFTWSWWLVIFIIPKSLAANPIFWGLCSGRSVRLAFMLRKTILPHELTFSSSQLLLFSIAWLYTLCGLARTNKTRCA